MQKFDSVRAHGFGRAAKIAVSGAIVVGTLIASVPDVFAAGTGMTFTGTLTSPTMPDATATYQSFGGIFSDGGTIALFVIGAAISLGAILLVAKFGWGTVKSWITRANA